MTVRTRVAQLEKMMPGGQQIVVLYPNGLVPGDKDDDQSIDEYCAEHGVSRDAHRFICVTFVKSSRSAE